jgi:hypothetical protein
VARREAALAAKEKDVAAREAQLRREGKGPKKNWPLCFPIVHHDIANDVPPAMRGIVRQVYICFLVSGCACVEGRGCRMEGGGGDDMQQVPWIGQLHKHRAGLLCVRLQMSTQLEFAVGGSPLLRTCMCSSQAFMTSSCTPQAPCCFTPDVCDAYHCVLQAFLVCLTYNFVGSCVMMGTKAQDKVRGAGWGIQLRQQAGAARWDSKLKAASWGSTLGQQAKGSKLGQQAGAARTDRRRGTQTEVGGGKHLGGCRKQRGWLSAEGANAV